MKNFLVWIVLISTAALGVAAHECGHALQHAEAYGPLMWRMTAVGATTFASQIVMWLPVLGICYGMQLACDVLGAKVTSNPAREFGRARIHVLAHDDLFAGVPHDLDVWMSHGDKVTQLPDGFKVMASTDACPIAGMADETRRFYGVQFHPESILTTAGKELLRNFLRSL